MALATTLLVAAALLFGLAAPALAQTRVVLTSQVTILEREDEPGAVRKATEDLASDLEKVFGTRPRIIQQVGDAGPNTIEIAPPTGGSAESFSIATRDRHVVLSGADMRGQIYAIYQFSQDYLGVDPMYYWTDNMPARRTKIILPARLHRAYPSPVFKYRGFFINDEDQLTGWAPGEAVDHSGISLAVMDKVYETILRLKGNMVVPSTWAFPDDPQMKAAGERGLILNQHHATPLGMNVARWPADVPYSLSTHPEILEQAWTNAARSYDPHQEILWTVGLRGLSDAPYSAADPSVLGDNQKLGELISKAIADQMRIVRQVQPKARFITNLWMEGDQLMKDGYLKIPPEVTIVWADRGYGLVQDGGHASKGQGFYFHVAMMNYHANQLSELVPVDRIHSEYGRFIRAGATEFNLINTSDLRAVAMTAEATMDSAWAGPPKSGGAHGYYLDWAKREFGEAAAPAIAKIYEDYFQAMAHSPSGDPYGDQHYHTEARALMLGTMISPPYFTLPGQAPKWQAPRLVAPDAPNDPLHADLLNITKASAAEFAACADAAPRWDKLWREAQAAAALVPADRRPYYDYAVLTMIAINRDSNHMLMMISRAAQDVLSGDRAKAKQAVLATLPDFDEIGRFEAQSEYGKWRNWWRGDWLTGIGETHQMVESFGRWLDDPMTALPPPVISSGWQAYYHIMHYEGDRRVSVK